MTDQSLRAAARAFGTLLADIGGREALRALGVLGPTPGPPVLCVLLARHSPRLKSHTPTWAGCPLS